MTYDKNGKWKDCECLRFANEACTCICHVNRGDGEPVPRDKSCYKCPDRFHNHMTPPDKAIEMAVLLLSPNFTERADRLAEMFYKDTGYMAPGKSVPPELAYHQPPDDALAVGYRDWYQRLVGRTHHQPLDSTLAHSI